MSMVLLSRMTAGGVDMQGVVSFVTNSNTATAMCVSDRAQEVIWYPGYNTQVYKGQKRRITFNPPQHSLLPEPLLESDL